MGKLDTDVSFELNLHDLYKECSVGEVAKIISSMMMYKIEHHGKTLSEWMDLIVSGEYEPVKHGKWIQGKIARIHWKYNCSECGNPIYDKIKPYNYCPYCGAKMGGVTDEN